MNHKIYEDLRRTMSYMASQPTLKSSRGATNLYIVNSTLCIQARIHIGMILIILFHSSLSLLPCHDMQPSH